MQRAERSTRQVNGVRSPFLDSSPDLRFVRSGCTLLDLVLGGGWPIGRVANIVGDKSTGKTLLAIEAMANFAKLYPEGKIWYRESESAFNTSYAEALGMPLERVKLWNKKKREFNTVEIFYKDLRRQTRWLTKLNKRRKPDNQIYGLYILDSLDALSDRKEMEREIDKDTMGQDKPRQMSVMFRKIIAAIEQSNMCVIIISQVRSKIGISFGRKTSRSGGRAMDFYCSQVLYLSHVGNIVRKKSRQSRVVGVEIRAKCDKNKIALPQRECDLPIRFGYGIEDLQANLNWLKEAGKLKKVGIGPETANKLIKNKDGALDNLSNQEYKSLLKASRKAVKAGWRSTEESFLPPRKKYA